MTHEGQKYWEQILAYSQKNAESQRTIKGLSKRKKDGLATYQDGTAYAEAVADNWASALQHYIGPSASIPNGVTQSDIEEMVSIAMSKNYKNVAYFMSDVEGVVLDSARIGMKPVTVALDPEKKRNLLKKIQDTAEDGADGLINPDNSWLIDSYVQRSVSHSAVTDSIHANARIQSKAGLYTIIERDAGAGCCNWCTEMSGSYRYGDEPKDFYSAHSGCTCTWTKRVGKTIESVMSFGTENGKTVKMVSSGKLK